MLQHQKNMKEILIFAKKLLIKLKNDMIQNFIFCHNFTKNIDKFYTTFQMKIIEIEANLATRLVINTFIKSFTAYLEWFLLKFLTI